MTDQEINVAIAEECGWLAAPNADGDLTEAHLTRTWVEWLGPNGEHESEPPDYVNDLNAMHEALASLPLESTSTARQRAEAFLRTVGKWKDGGATS